MKKFKLLMGFLSPLIVLIIAVVCVGGIFAAMQQKISMRNDFLYEKHIGTGTEEDPYLIYSLGILDENGHAEAGSFNYYAGANEAGINFFVSNNKTNTSDYNYFRQVQDIVPEAAEQVLETGFNGYYNAYGRNITINNTLFKKVGQDNKNSYIKNLNVLTSKTLNAAAGLADELYSSLENVTFSGSIKNTSNIFTYGGGNGLIAGGLVAKAYSGAKLTMCRNLGSVSSGNLSGGLIGYVEKTNDNVVEIKYSYNKGIAKTTASGLANYVGGLVGYNNANLSIYDSYNIGILEAHATNAVGGMLGSNKSSVAINRTYSLISGNGSKALVADGNITSSGDNVEYNFTDNSGTILGASSGEALNNLQNANSYPGWNFAENADSLENNWVMAFGSVTLSDAGKTINLFLPHLWYEVEGLTGEFNLTYVAGEGTTGSTPQMKTYSKKNSEIQIEKNINGLTKNGYDFLGWATLENAKEPLFSLDPEGKMPALSKVYSLLEEVSLYPVWEVKSYSLFFYGNGGTWGEIPDGFEVQNDGGLKYEYNVEKDVVFPTSANISRVGFNFEGFEITHIPDGGFALTKNAGVEQEIGVGSVCTNLAKGTHGSIVLKAKWQGNDNIKYKVIYELANKLGNFNDADGVIERYIFETTGIAGSVLSKDNLGLVAIDGKTLKIYDSSKDFADMEVVQDSSLISKIKTHFVNVYEVSTTSSENIIEGDGSTIATVKANRNLYSITLTAGENAYRVKATSEVEEKFGNTITLSAYFDTTLSISAELETGYIFNDWKNEAGETFSGSQSLIIDSVVEDLNLTASAIGGYTLEIYPNSPYATLNQTALAEYIEALEDYEKENYEVKDNGTIVISNRRLGYNQIIPLSSMLGNNTLYQIIYGADKQIEGLSLVGFSLNKNDEPLLGQDYNPELIVGELEYDETLVKNAGTVKLYAIWSEPTATITLDLNNSDATKPNSDIEVIDEGIIPNKFIDILEGSSISSLGYDKRAGFTFAGWEVVSDNALGFTKGEILTSTELENKDIYGDVELKATWSGNQTVYRVVYKTENLDGLGYSDATIVTNNSTAGNSVFVSNIINAIAFDGFEVYRVTIKESDTSEEIILKGEGATEEKTTFELLGNKNQIITVYFNREVFEIVLENNDDGVESVSFVDSTVSGIVSTEENSVTARYGTILSVDATLKSGYSWKSWNDDAGNELYSAKLISFEVRQSLKLLPSTHFQFKIAFANDGASVNGTKYITKDMCSEVTTLPENVTKTNESNYSFVLEHSFNSGVISSYNASTYINFKLFELKSEYEDCQYQIGWKEKDGNVLISWNKYGTIEINKEFKFEPTTANEVIILYAVWSENEHTLEIDYDSDLVQNETISKVAPFSLSLKANPTKTGYNFLEYIAEVWTGTKYVEVDNFNSSTFIVTKNTRITAIWTTAGTQTNFVVEFEIGKSSGGYETRYLSYTGTTFNVSTLSRSNLSGTFTYCKLPTDTIINLKELSKWATLDENRLFVNAIQDYEVTYYNVSGGRNIKLSGAEIGITSAGELHIKIRYQLKTAIVQLKINDGTHVEKVGLDAVFGSTIREFFIGARVEVYALSSSGYEVTGWNYSYVANDETFPINSANYSNGNFYFVVPSGASSITATPETEAIDYTISLNAESVVDATMENGDGPNIKRVLDNRENIYTIENATDFTLKSVRKIGYKFLGYSVTFENGRVYSTISGTKTEISSGNIVTNISAGSYGNIELSAVFVVNKYVISFNGNRGDIAQATEIVVPSESRTIEFGAENIDLGVATISNIKFGFKGWSLEPVNYYIVSNANGITPKWTFHDDSWTKIEGTNGDTYSLTLYAVWVEFPKSIKITGDIDKIESLTITTLVGESNAKLLNNLFDQSYEIYLNEGYVVKVEVEMVAGYKVKDNPLESWVAGENTTWTWSAACIETPEETHTGINFELNVTTWISTTDVAEIEFVAETIPYTLSYDLNYSYVGATAPSITGEVQTTVRFTSNIYETENSSLTRPLTPSEIAALVSSYEDSANTKNLIPKGYTFFGWYRTKDCLPGDEIMYYTGSTWAYGSWTTTDNGTLYAKWVEQEYDITLYYNYNSEDNSVFGSGEVSFNNEVSGWNVPTREGYKFLGWFKDRAETIQLTNELGLSIGVDWVWSESEELVAYAGWKAETYNLYAVVENAHNNNLQSEENRSSVINAIVSGYPESSIAVTFDSSYSVAVVPTRTGYNFAGWFIQNAKGEYVQITKGDGSAYSAIWNIDLGEDNANVEMFAKWEQNEEGVSVIVKYNYENLNGTFTAENPVVKKLPADNDITATLLESILATEKTGFSTEVGYNQIEFKYYKGGTELTTAESQIVYADGSLIIEVYYYRIRLTLSLSIDNLDRISEISYTIPAGLVLENFETTKIRKLATVRYGASVTLNTNINDGAEFVNWWNVETKSVFDKIDATNTFVITENLSLQAISKWSEYTIIYRDCEIENTIYTHASLPYYLPEAVRAGFNFLGFTFDICEDGTCDHETCEKYFDNSLVNNVFTAKIIIDGKEESVSIPVNLNNASNYIVQILEKAKGTVVLRAVWESVDGIAFKVVIHEQGLNGVYGNLPVKVLYGLAGMEIKVSSRETLTAYDSYENGKYTGTLYYIFNLQNVWSNENWVNNYYIFMEYTDYDKTKYSLTDMVADAANPTSEEFLNASNSVRVIGNGSAIIHIYKERKVKTIEFNITDSISSFYPFSTLTLAAGDANKLTAFWFTNNETQRNEQVLLSGGATSSLSLINSNGRLIGTGIGFNVFYGGSYILTIQTDNGFTYSIVFKNGDLQVNLGENYIASGNNHTLINTSDFYTDIYISASAVEYKLKFELNDSSYDAGSTQVSGFTAEGTTFVEDKNGNYIELVITATSSEAVLTEVLPLLRDGYTLTGYKVVEIAETTQNMLVRLTDGGTAIALTNEISDAIYSILPGAYGPEATYLATFEAVWEANTYELEIGFNEGSSEYVEFTFDELYVTDPGKLFVDFAVAHQTQINKGKKFLGWFKIPQGSYTTIVDGEFTEITNEQKETILSNYLFGLKSITGVSDGEGNLYNIRWNLEEYTIYSADSEVSELEEYILESIEESNKYISNISSIDELEDLTSIYAWYIDDSYTVNFDLNLSSILSNATTELASFADDTSNPKLTTTSKKWKPDKKESQKFPTVETLDDWGSVIAWSLTANGKPGDDGYFAISPTDTYINYDISSSLVRRQTLYAIYEGSDVSVSYDFNLGRVTTTEQIYTETNKVLFNPTFTVSAGGTDYALTKANIKSILGSEAIIGGISIDYYNLVGFELVLNSGETGVVSSENDAFILASDAGSVKTMEEWQEKYVLKGNITFKAVWELNAVKVVYHANYASDVNLNSLGLTEADITKYKPYNLGSTFTILNYNDANLGFNHVVSGLFVGWATSADALVPNTVDYVVGNELVASEAKVIELYAIWEGSISNPFEITNACEFNYLAGVDCGGNLISYRDYLASFNAFASETKFYFDFVADINETSSMCGSEICGYEEMYITALNKAVVKGYIDENDNASFDSGESISIIKKGKVLFSEINDSIVSGLEFEIETYFIEKALLANSINNSEISNISIVDYENISKDSMTFVYSILAYEVKDSKLQNIKNNVNLSTNMVYANGGLFYIVDNSKLEDITNNGDITLGGIGTTFGAIAYELIVGDSTILKNVVNNGNITVGEYGNSLGGLFAVAILNNSESITFEGIHNHGNVINSKQYAGGLIAEISSNNATGEIAITKSSNTGDIKIIEGNKENSVIAGGLIGNISGTNLTISESYNTGSIIDNSSSGDFTYSSILGGFVGYSDSDLIIENSYVTSKIVGETGENGASFAGGFVGFAEEANVSVSSSYSMADLETRYNSGIATVNLGTLNVVESYYESTLILENFLSGDMNGKLRSAMQQFSTFSSWDFIQHSLVANRTTESWLSQTANSLIYTKMRVGGYDGLYKLPKLWWEDLAQDNETFNIVYDKNDDSATTINVSGNTGAFTLSNVGSITVPTNIVYDNESGQIKDTNSYTSGNNVITTLGGAGFKIVDSATEGREETKFAWWTKAGYDFLGFSLDPNATEEKDLISSSLTNVYYSGTLRLYAIWSPMSYRITYNNTKGVENPNSTSYVVGDEVQLKALQNANGYEFSHWINSAGETQNIISAGTSGDLTFTAVWTNIPYSVVIDLNTDFNIEAEDSGDIKESSYTIENVTNVNSILSISSTSEINSVFSLSLNTNLYKFRFFKLVSISSVGAEAKIFGLDGGELAVEDEISGITTGSFGEFKIVAVWEGDKDAPFEIPDVDTFNTFADGGFFASENNYYFKQVNSIEVQSSETLSVVDLNGVYDAQGYTLSFANGKTASLFKTIGVKGAVKNLDVDFGTSNFAVEQGYDGLIADVLYGNIENISVNGEITVTGSIDYFGNIGFAYEGSSISGFRNYANILIASNSAGVTTTVRVGGIVGGVSKAETDTSGGFVLKNSSNEGNISIENVVAESVGGLVGLLFSDSVDTYKIKDSFNSGNIVATAANVGGITGSLQGNTSIISTCYNLGTISCGSYSSGNIAGITGLKVGTIEYSYTIGTLAGDITSKGAIFAVGSSNDAKDLYNYYVSGDYSFAYGGMSKTLEELQTRTTYDSIWDIQDNGTIHGETSEWSYIWAESGTVKHNGNSAVLSLPRLWWEEV